LSRSGIRRSFLSATAGQYYLHVYAVEQPDLNWANPAVREAMIGVLRFWLDRRVDGFRVDAIHGLIKDPMLAPKSRRPGTRT
jgi:alpha-glucosidase